MRNKFELVHSSSRIVSQDISNNKDKRGEGSSRDIKGKHKEMYEDEFAMKDKERKKRKNGHFKKRCVIAECKTCNKIHTELYYLKTGACFRCGQLGHQVRNCPR